MPNRRKSILAILSISLLTFMVSGCKSTVSHKIWHQSLEPWNACQISLPKDYGKITLLIQKAHPFLAEYNEKLNIHNNKQLSRTFNLNIDTGGEEFLNFYLSKSGKPTLRLLGKWNELSIDLKSQTEKPLNGNIDPKEWLYLGRCDKRTQPIRFVSFSEAKEELIPELTGG